MAGNHDEHGNGGHGGHSGKGAGEWMELHMGGAIMVFGERVEKIFERLMVLIVNGFFVKVGMAFLFLMVPVVLLELVLHTVRF